jgi:hypothetical protein
MRDGGVGRPRCIGVSANVCNGDRAVARTIALRDINTENLVSTATREIRRPLQRAHKPGPADHTGIPLPFLAYEDMVMETEIVAIR